MSLRLSATPQERRRARRIKRDSRAQLIFWPAIARSAPLDVELIDYSSTGVGVLHDQAILIGQKFVLTEPFVTRGSTCIYTVARCDRREDGQFIVGLHACTSTDQVPSLEHGKRREDSWAGVAFIVATVIAAAAVVAMTMR